VVVAAEVVVTVDVVCPVVTCNRDACPAEATEVVKPIAETPSRTSVASAIGRKRGGPAPAGRLIQTQRASPHF
jgi:hypothetical protein